MAIRDAVRGLALVFGVKLAADKLKRDVAHEVADELDYRKAHGVSRREGRVWGWLAFLVVAGVAGGVVLLVVLGHYGLR